MRGRYADWLRRWMKTIDSFTPGGSGAMSVALSVVNLKNVLLVVGAADAISALAT